MRRPTSIALLALMALTAVACSGQPKDDEAGEPVVITSTIAPGKGGKTKTSDATTPDLAGNTSKTTSGTGSGGRKIITITAPTKPGGVPEADLFKGAAIAQGINKDEVVICEHAGITLASSFGNDPDMFDAYWRTVNDAGGIYGRKVKLNLQDDGYNANQASSAFDSCNSANPFLIIGGIGYDQIPAVRDKAEANKELYIYGTATAAGTKNDLYSFAAAPTVEWYGKRFAEVAAKYNKGKKVGVVTVETAGWKPGADTFEKRLSDFGMKVSMRREIINNNAPFTGIVKDLEDAGIQLVFLNINALAYARFIAEADSQEYYPRTLGWSFNLPNEKVGLLMRKFPLNQGLSTSPVWDPATDYPWDAEAAKMKAAYRKYYNHDTPNDIDWIQWIGMKAFHRLLLDCGASCNRNKIVGLLLSGYKKTESPNCQVDFSKGGGRFGGFRTNYWQGLNRDSTQVWKQVETCRSGF